MRSVKKLFLVLCSFVWIISIYSPVAYPLEISDPVPHKPKLWQPGTVVSFGDSLTDSHGDTYRNADTALSTYNLLRTLRGEKIEQANGPDRTPMDISELISQRSSIENIKATFDLYVREIRREGREKGLLGNIRSQLTAFAVKKFGKFLTDIAHFFDRFEEVADEVLLEALESTSNWLDRKLRKIDRKSRAYTALTSLKRKVEYMIRVVEIDLEDFVLARSEELLVRITGKMGSLIPLIPDPDHYATGKWTVGQNMDQMWIEVLVRMMSTHRHKVTLDNRAMAGSWILCAPSKIDRMDAFRETADSLKESVMFLFQGSLVPPCEGAIVTSYLNEQRRVFNDENDRYPHPDEAFIEEDILVIFFNGANDFLNEWEDPDDVAQEQEHDIRNVLDAGATRVAVVLLPDISRTPRFHNTDRASKVSGLITVYNASMTMRLARIWEDYGGAKTDRVATIDGNRLFTELQNEDRWDLEHPVLNVPIPGVDDEDEVESKQATRRRKARDDNDFVSTELLENRAFDDNWRIRKGSRAEASNGIPFFADSVHPSAEAHYAIAKKACLMMAKDFNIPCDPNNYTEKQAQRECAARRAQAQRDEL